jgi:hypothetical protein
VSLAMRSSAARCVLLRPVKLATDPRLLAGAVDCGSADISTMTAPMMAQRLVDLARTELILLRTYL